MLTNMTIAKFYYTNALPSPPRHQFMEPELSKWLSVLLATPLQHKENLKIPRDVKPVLTEKLIEYYSLHLSGFANIKSQAVLEAVWS